MTKANSQLLRRDDEAALRHAIAMVSNSTAKLVPGAEKPPKSAGATCLVSFAEEAAGQSDPI